MTDNQRRHETICLICAVAVFAAICLLMARVINISGQTAQIMKEYYLSQLSMQTVIPLIETIEPSVGVDKMVCEGQNEAGEYDNTPAKENTAEATETTATAELIFEWAYPITESELRLTALIAELEDRGAMQEIAEVILNRVNSGRFKENTVESVIYAKGQFYTVKKITESMTPSDEAVEAATAVFRDGASTIGEAIFFAEQSVNPSRIAKNLYLVAEIGQTIFYGQE